MAANESDTQTGDGSSKRSRSGTSYPYFDLDSSIKVADVIHSSGGGSCTSDQLAAWLSYKSTKSGTYLTRIAAARQFGFIQTTGDRHTVTERGMTILAPVMPHDSIKAKVEAFMDVELFAKVFQQFRGTSLPPESGLKNLFRGPNYAILPDRVDQAVRVLMNSAEQAGFFAATGDKSRLIMPPTNGTAPKPDESDSKQPAAGDKPKPTGHGAAVVDHTGGVHFAIVGLLRELPPPGTVWPSAKKQRFISAFQATIDFIYPEEEQ